MSFFFFFFFPCAPPDLHSFETKHWPWMGPLLSPAELAGEESEALEHDLRTLLPTLPLFLMMTVTRTTTIPFAFFSPFIFLPLHSRHSSYFF